MSDAWCKFYPSDWLAGTRGLTMAEAGLYITMIMMMYEKGAPIDDDHTALARLAGAPKAAFARALQTLLRSGKIIETDDGLWSRRVEKELKTRAHKAKVASQSASARWQKGEEKQRGPDANASNSQCETDATRNQKPDTRVPTSSDEASPVPEDDRTILFREGLNFVKSRGIPEKQARSLFGKCLQLCGDDATAVLEAVREAYRTRPAELQPWLLGRFKAKPKSQRFDRWAGVGDPNRDPFADEVPPSSDPFEGLDLGNVVAFGGRS